MNKKSLISRKSKYSLHSLRFPPRLWYSRACNRDENPWKKYLVFSYRRGAPPRHNPLRFLRQKNWWWQGRGHPDRHQFDVPNHGVCNLPRHHHCHRHSRRTTPRRTQRYVCVALPPWSPFFSTRAPLVHAVGVATGFLGGLCKAISRERFFQPSLALFSRFTDTQLPTNSRLQLLLLVFFLCSVYCRALLSF